MLLYAACVLLLCCGPSGLEYLTNILGFESQLVPEMFFFADSISLSLIAN